MSEEDFRAAQEAEREMMVRKPYTKEEMDHKVDNIRKNFTQKMNKWTNKISISVSSDKTTRALVKRFEGEQWIEGGRTWECKHGVHQTTSIMEMARMPWWCPKCEKAMNHRFDRKFFYLRGWCYDCNINFENDLRIRGEWEQFERTHVRENEKSYLRDKLSEMQDYIENFVEPQIHFGDGRWEKLATRDQFDGLFLEMEKEMNTIVNRLEQIEKEELEEEENELHNKANI